MNQIIIHNAASFQFIIDDLLSNNFAQKLETKIFECMWCISIDPSIPKKIKRQYLTIGVTSLLKNIQKQNVNCTFYMWFDEMAEQLRFNIIPKHQTKLPFGCQIAIVNDPNIILEQCVASDGNGIPWSEFVEDNNNCDEVDDEHTYTLSVFVKHIYP